MDALKAILAVIGGYTVVGLVASAWQFFRGDRSGNSGRFRHWSEDDE